MTRRQRGLVVVEAAIVLPVLLLMLLGVAEVGRALYHYNTLEKTIRDATRYLATNAWDGDTGVINLTTAVVTTTRNLAVYGNPTGTGSPLLPGLATTDVTVSSPDVEHVQVSVAYAYTPLFAVIPTFGMTDNDITVSTTMTADLTMRAL